jgi:hypothetical protein
VSDPAATVVSTGRKEATPQMVIDCNECAMQGTDQCGDCVVTFILREEGQPVVVDAEEARALRALGTSGLVPLLRLVPKPAPDLADAG